MPTSGNLTSFYQELPLYAESVYVKIVSHQVIIKSLAMT